MADRLAVGACTVPMSEVQLEGCQARCRLLRPCTTAAATAGVAVGGTGNAEARAASAAAWGAAVGMEPRDRTRTEEAGRASPLLEQADRILGALPA